MRKPSANLVTLSLLCCWRRSLLELSCGFYISKTVPSLIIKMNGDKSAIKEAEITVAVDFYLAGQSILKSHQCSFPYMWPSVSVASVICLVNLDCIPMASQLLFCACRIMYSPWHSQWSRQFTLASVSFIMNIHLSRLSLCWLLFTLDRSGSVSG